MDIFRVCKKNHGFDQTGFKSKQKAKAQRDLLNAGGVDDWFVSKGEDHWRNAKLEDLPHLFKIMENKKK